MSKRARMGEIAQMIQEPAERAAPQSPPQPVDQETGNPKTGKQVIQKPTGRRSAPRITGPQSGEVHRPYGERGDFEKITVTLPSEVRGLLLDESLRRKKDRSKDWAMAAIVREAIAAYLGPKVKAPAPGD
jgi:hypothetical protein